MNDKKSYEEKEGYWKSICKKCGVDLWINDLYSKESSYTCYICYAAETAQENLVLLKKIGELENELKKYTTN